MVSPDVSCSGRYCRTFAMICASWARVSSSQNTTCAPVSAATLDREAHPVAHRRVLHLARAPHVARRDVVLHHHVAGAVHDAHGAVGGDLEGLVVRPVLLGLLRHQPDIRHRAHRGRVERAVGAAVVDDRGVHAGVRGVGNDGLGVLELAGRVPHLPGVADHRRHRRVDDDVARHVQVGDAAVGVDHRQRRARSPARPRCRPRSARARRREGSRHARARRRGRRSRSRRCARTSSPCFANTSAK